MNVSYDQDILNGMNQLLLKVPCGTFKGTFLMPLHCVETILERPNKADKTHDYVTLKRQKYFGLSGTVNVYKNQPSW